MKSWLARIAFVFPLLWSQYGHGPMWHQTSDEPLLERLGRLGIPCSQPGGPGSFVACHLTITDDATESRYIDLLPARPDDGFMVDANGRVTHVVIDGKSAETNRR